MAALTKLDKLQNLREEYTELNKNRKLKKQEINVFSERFFTILYLGYDPAKEKAPPPAPINCDSVLRRSHGFHHLF